MTLLIVGEHPTLNESTAPFSNGLWRYFKSQAATRGLDVRNAHYLNCINTPAANMFSFCVRQKKFALADSIAIGTNLHLSPKVAQDIRDLERNIKLINPTLILAVGDIPLAVLCGQNKMKFARGRITNVLPRFGGFKCLPIMHPRAIMADITQEPIFAMDLAKAKRESAFPELRRTPRFLHLRPSIEDLESFWQEYILPSKLLSLDIETMGTQITCFGVAPSPDRALCVPFFDEENQTGNYWETTREELIAWKFVERCCSYASSLGQNFQYDVQYLLRKMGIAVPNWKHDTMILHHALQPEMEKGLGFLASIYTDEPAWKFMHRARASDRTAKKGDE